MKYSIIVVRLYVNKGEADIELTEGKETRTIYGTKEDGYMWIRTARACGYPETWKRFDNGDQIFTFTK